MVEKTILEMLGEYTDKQEITRESTFDVLGIDSLDVFNLVMELEEKLGCTLELDGSLKTVGELIDFVEANKK
ncbi:MAG: phosphopantetheine-binding protein [Clostridia bacterium]|nr:phosphopantetheine-binding protein [Clostridia bacterium]